MFLDASVIIANLLEEAEAVAIRTSLFKENDLMTSPLAMFEASTRLAAVKRVSIEEGYQVVSGFLQDAGIRVAAIDAEVGRIAHRCASTYHHSTGHPARLNMGDCFAYAAARSAGVPLAYKGNDFNHTDIEGRQFGS